MMRITLRLPDDVHALVVARAETERRSLNSQIVHLLETALADESP
ncbi:MAG TPA: Arc family DNA-binding protein [Nonomuraea sp.]|nr:Arc family DNA-binding protein [Nonomuraea sp.]